MHPASIWDPPETLIARFDEAPNGVLRERDVADAIRGSAANWPLAQTGTLERLIAWLVQNTKLKQISIDSDLRTAPIIRYAWGSVSPYAVACSLERSPYVSHGAAAFLHGLIDSSPVIYVNQEQKPKLKPAGGLSQAAIDRAFKQKQRASSNRYHWPNATAVVLNGKNTRAFGVSDMQIDRGIVSVTGIERTLIDIAVRPVYCGGAKTVMQAYRTAKQREISIRALADMLVKLDYVYPYHQVIGFYLERAGWPAETLNAFRDPGIQLDFFLEHGMVQRRQDSNWRVFYPTSLDTSVTRDVGS